MLHVGGKEDGDDLYSPTSREHAGYLIGSVMELFDEEVEGGEPYADDELWDRPVADDFCGDGRVLTYSHYCGTDQLLTTSARTGGC